MSQLEHGWISGGNIGSWLLGLVVVGEESELKVIIDSVQLMASKKACGLQDEG
jgi:hypothetical protein